jgi:hypothetical protein
MAPLCGRRLAVLEQTIGIAAILDVVVMQPVFVAAVYLWRWLATDEVDGRAVHDLHPVDGELVSLGDEDEPDMGVTAEPVAGVRGAAYRVPETTSTSQDTSDAVLPHIHLSSDDGMTGASDEDPFGMVQDAETLVMDDDDVDIAAFGGSQGDFDEQPCAEPIATDATSVWGFASMQGLASNGEPAVDGPVDAAPVAGWEAPAATVCEAPAATSAWGFAATQGLASDDEPAADGPVDAAPVTAWEAPAATSAWGFAGSEGLATDEEQAPGDDLWQ